VVKPDFVLNDPRYAACSIMIAGPNFGCGSSRETAVWALMNYGIRCVIASSFGEIFYENCFQNGLLPVALTRAEVEAIARRVQAAPKPEVTVDLVACRIDLPDGSQYSFSLASDRREALLEGLDEFDILLRKLPDIEAFQARDAEQRPWIFARHVDGDAAAATTGS
jgi:3-isopropylmalate/(R)-2-methylmalate dehydratase small subunit